MQDKNTSVYNNHFEFIKNNGKREVICESFIPSRYSMKIRYLPSNIDHGEFNNFCSPIHDLAEMTMHRNGTKKFKVSQSERNLYRNLAKRLPRVRGLTFDSSQIRWISYWRNSQGKQVQKHFPVSKYGFNEARKLALSFIENQEAVETCFKKKIGQNYIQQPYYKKMYDEQESDDTSLLAKNPLSLYLLSQPVPTLSALNSATKPGCENHHEQNSCVTPPFEKILPHLGQKTNGNAKDKQIPWTRASTISTCAFVDNASVSIQSSYMRTPSLSGTFSTSSPYNTRKNSINPEVEKCDKKLLKSGSEDATEQMDYPVNNFEEDFQASFLRARWSSIDKDYTEDARRLPKVKGVHFDSRQQRWCAYGGRKKECFSVYRYGFEKARELALESRRRTQNRCCAHKILVDGMEKGCLTDGDLSDAPTLYHLLNNNIKRIEEKKIIVSNSGWNDLKDKNTKAEGCPIKIIKKPAFCGKEKTLGITFSEEIKQSPMRSSYNAETNNLAAVQYAEEAAQMPKVPNVYWHKHKLCWYWRRKGAGYGSSKCFSARMYGFQKARALAIQYGKDQVSNKKLKSISGNIEDILSAMATTAEPSVILNNL